MSTENQKPDNAAKKSEKKPKKPSRTQPRLGRGFRDIFSNDLRARNWMLDRIRAVYESYGFSPLETPALEYLDCLGKFLPESNQPDAGVFAFKDEDEEWVALRYDLTAPLSRVVAQYANDLQRPYRRYQVGPVYRTDKPGPGRFREFYQFDFDIVGAGTMMADTEVCCVMADALEAIDVPRGDYIVRVNNRKVLNGVLEAAGVALDSEKAGDVLRSIDKLDKLGIDGVTQLLQKGRMDESGDFTPGCGLGDEQVAVIKTYLACRATTRKETCDRLAELVGESKVGADGVAELREIDGYLTGLDYNDDRVTFDPTVVRGLAYYTGPVFEAALTIETIDEDGNKKEFGSVMGGGRYDDLVKRFTGQEVPATGASMGVDRMLAALKFIGRLKEADLGGSAAQVLVTTMDKSRRADYLKIARELRGEGIRVDLYLGNKNIAQQLKYADKLGIPYAIIAGSNEFDAGMVQLKDLKLGEELAQEITDRDEWRKGQPAQQEVPLSDLAAKLKELLAR